MAQRDSSNTAAGAVCLALLLLAATVVALGASVDPDGTRSSAAQGSHLTAGAPESATQTPTNDPVIAGQLMREAWADARARSLSACD